MRVLRLLATLAAVAPAGCIFPTLEKPPPAPPAVEAKAGRRLPPDTQVYELANGLTLVVYESHASPIVTIDTWVGTGSANETAENNGVSHFLEHLLFKGGQKYGPRQVDRTLESLGAQINAATGDDSTHYYITVAGRHIEQALDVHADMLLHAALPPKEVDAERKAVIEEINRANDSPQRKLYREMQKLLFRVHPYGLDTLGPPENIARIPRETILEYYRRWYVPKNMTVVIAGDVRAERAKELVEKYFGAAPGAPLPHAARPAEPPFEEPRSATVEDERVKQAYVAVAWHAPGMGDLDGNAALDATALLLGQGESSRLHQRLVEREKSALSVRAGNWTEKEAGTFFVFAVCPTENADKVRAAILEEVGTISRAPPSLDEVSKAKTSLDRDFVYEAESTSGIASLYGSFATMGDISDAVTYREKVRDLDPLSVVEASRRFLRPDRAATVRIFPKGTDPSRIEAAPAPSAAPPASAAAESSTVVQTRLPNGTVLIVKRNPKSDVVAIHGLLAGGERTAARAGLAELAARTALKGTTHRSAEPLAQEIDGSGFSFSVTAESDFVAIRGQGLQQDLHHLLSVARDVFYNASFPPDQIDHERKQMLDEIKRSREQPSGPAFEELRLALFPNHPYGDVGRRIEANLQGARAIGRAEIVDFYQATFRPERLTLAVVGNVRPEEVSAAVSDLFPPRAPPPPAVLREPAGETALQKAVTKRTPMETNQTWLVQAFLVPGILDPDYPALKLLSTLLGRGLSSRLFVNLRELRGLAYSTGAEYQGSIDPTGFYFFIGTDPVNTRAVQEGFDAEIQRLQDEEVPAAELADAKQKLIGGFHLSHETSALQAYYLAFFELAGRGFAFDTAFPQAIEAVTAADLQRVARKYFGAPGVKSLVGPAEKIAEGADLPAFRDIPIVPEEQRTRPSGPSGDAR